MSGFIIKLAETVMFLFFAYLLLKVGTGI